MAQPPAHVLRAFGVSGIEPERASGGHASTWLIGDLAIKQADLPEAELSWQAMVLSDLQSDRFRVAVPVPSHTGQFVIDGWCATVRLAGSHQPQRWLDIVQVGSLFHEATRHIERPPFLDTRTDPWSVGDRVAWGDVHVADLERDTKHLDRLLTCRKPVTGTSQLIHGDLTGNVLFDAVQPPAIIDMSPYWRPPEFATAIVVADALVWEGAGDELIDNASDTNDLTQYLLRALIYRIVTDRLARPTESPRPHAGDPYRRAVELACR